MDFLSATDLESSTKIFCGTCPDQVCEEQIYFCPSFGNTAVCENCGQTFKHEAILNTFLPDRKIALRKMVTKCKFTKGSEFVRVNGLSNFFCKILSPFLTLYGMDKGGNARLLTEIGHSEFIDCGKVLGNRTFSISPDHMDTVGYGKDQSGSLDYLSDILDILKHHNGKECIVPVHVDGDGHCLVHAISRALIGRELFWHSLRRNLQDHLEQSLSTYMELFKEFHDKEDWKMIIDEAGPYFSSGGLTVGLGNMHIFGLCNVLKRPIMLLDSLQKMQNAGDYTGLFVPALINPEQCNKSPICVAWSGSAHNHFVPLVAIEGKPSPQIPSSIIPRVWGIPVETAQKYLNPNEDGSITVCEGKPLKNSYLRKLAAAMETIFLQQNNVAAVLVEDLCKFAYRLNDSPGLRYETIILIAKEAVQENRLFRCLTCKALQDVNISLDDLKPGGRLYNLMIACHQSPKPGKIYTFPFHKVDCFYDTDTDQLYLRSCECRFCNSQTTRSVDKTGTIQYEDGDATPTPSIGKTKCHCGQKHYWAGKEYDNLPEQFAITVDWEGRNITVPITWFHGDSNPELNSNAQHEAQRIVNEYFPQDFTSDHLMNQLICAIQERCSNLGISEKRSDETYSEVGRYNADDGNSSTQNLERELVGILQDHKELGDAFLKQKQFVHEDAFTERAKNEKVVKTSADIKPRSSSVIPNKRKSNGEKAAVKTETAPGQDQKILVKLSDKKGLNATVKLKQNISLDMLKEKISQIFKIDKDKQILKSGFPPKVLQPSSNESPLGLKSGDKITIYCKENKVAGQHHLTNPLKNQLAETDNGSSEQKHLTLSEKLRELIDLQTQSAHTSMWSYAMEKPNLFLPEGVFYEQFKTEIGVTHGMHCCLPLIPGKIFRYNGDMDRIELCLEPTGHHPIDGNIKDILNQFPQYQEKAQRLPGLPQGVEPAEKISLSADDRSIKPHSQAPGFHTVGEVPTTLSNEEKAFQREMLVQKVKEIQANTET
ncbi:unnamed protein product [Clavelina lepadiformis]|uniref:OTU domain-containing protein n=1 Tax=Clavelina lepadiformis TaxID=159417 RepID=A0ABP0G1S6_CLALP